MWKRKYSCERMKKKVCATNLFIIWAIFIYYSVFGLSFRYFFCFLLLLEFTSPLKFVFFFFLYFISLLLLTLSHEREKKKEKREMRVRVRRKVSDIMVSRPVKGSRTMRKKDICECVCVWNTIIKYSELNKFLLRVFAS